MSPALSETPKIGFLATRPILYLDIWLDTNWGQCFQSVVQFFIDILKCLSMHINILFYANVNMYSVICLYFNKELC